MNIANDKAGSTELREKKRFPVWIPIAIIAIAIIASVAGVTIYSNSPAQLAKKQISLGERYLTELNYEEAVAAFRSALEIDPMNANAREALVQAYLTWADALADSGDLDGACRILTEASATIEDERLSAKLNEIQAQQGSNAINSLQLSPEEDKKWKRVPVCTYKDQPSELDLSPPHVYYAEFAGDFTKVGDHYEATGKLYSQAFILEDDLKSASVGSTVSYDGVEFTVTDMGEVDESLYGFKKWFVLDDQYVVHLQRSSSQDNSEWITGWSIFLLDPKSLDNPTLQGDICASGTKQVLILIDDNYQFELSGRYTAATVPHVQINELRIVNFVDQNLANLTGERVGSIKTVGGKMDEYTNSLVVIEK